MKFNWGTGIALFYTVFALSMIVMAVKSFGYDHSLVQENYYQADLDYQQQYDKISNANQSNLLRIKHRAGASEVTLEALPHLKEAVSGTILFFRPSNKYLDFKIPIQLDTVGQQFVPVDELTPGRWRVKVDYQVGEKAYYTEIDLVL
jgi:nitrogen fixation protein FixH